MSIEVRDLVFGYERGLNILDGFSASFDKCKVTALTGANGAGKTTLARLIMGILKPEAGDIAVDGERINDHTLAQRGRLIGYVMQNPARQIFSDTVESEIAYGLINLGLTDEVVRKRTEKYMRYFEIEQYRDTFPFELSHGEKQRVVLAAVMAMEPGYLILDEPTGSLDFRRKKLLGELLVKAKDVCGIVVISHDNDFIENYCEEKITMEECNERP